MIRLSVNVNKIATLRNSRGGSVPSVTDAVDACLNAGAPGITVHPRADERHIRRTDVLAIAAALERRGARKQGIEFNIEGDPRPDLIDLVVSVKPDQCTLVPVKAGEITSQAGWPPETGSSALAPAIARLKECGVRVSLFIDPTPAAVGWAASAGADRVELYTEPFARAYEAGGEVRRRSFDGYVTAARLAHDAGLGVNAGHDLDLENLTVFRTLPHLDEVSIGHALVSRALWVGLDRVVREYLAAVAGV
jgi:pyridoxine 5-phosphate synthase